MSVHILGPRDQTLVAQFVDKSLYWLNHLAGSDLYSYKSLPPLWVPLSQLIAHRKKCAFQNQECVLIISIQVASYP